MTAGSFAEGERILSVYRALVDGFRKRLRIDEAEALDLAHEAIVEMYEAMARFDPARGDFAAWASGFVRNLAWHRREGRRRHISLGDGEPAPEDPEILADLVRGEVTRYVRDSVAELPDLYRDTLERRFFKRMKLKEIAADLRVPTGTVKARLSRALEMLKGRLRFQNTTIRMMLK